jgi:hypothetical protein
MSLDRFVTGGAGYMDAEGTSYDSVVELIQVGILGQCMCEDAEANLRYVRDGLQHIARLTTALTTEQDPQVDFFEWYRAWQPAWAAEGQVLFGNACARQFFFYWADAEAFTEHGTGMPGWLTAKGRQLLDDLNELFDIHQVLQDELMG